MKMNPNDKTTANLRDLLASASFMAFECSGDDDQDAYDLTRRAFVEILQVVFPSNTTIHRLFPENKQLH
jgi:hypothetical protein